MVKKYYTVWEGYNIGVFSSWEECKKNISGYPTAKYKSFPTKEQAQKVANSVEDFAANLGGLPLDRAKTFYDEGIKSASDFKNWTEKELLALKGIGPATIKKLKENGIKFK